METSNSVTSFIQQQLGDEVHVFISNDTAFQIFDFSSLFLSSIHKHDFKRLALVFDQVYRSQDETHRLNQVITCMRSCKESFPDFHFLLIHPANDEIVLFKVK